MEVVKRETRGGIGFDLVLERATSEAPNKPVVIRRITTTDIESKLKAAEERRKSLEEKKLLQLKEKELQVIQLRTKKANNENEFRDTVRDSLEKRMAAFRQNRDNLLNVFKAKLRQHQSHIVAVRQNKQGVGNSVTVQ